MRVNGNRFWQQFKDYLPYKKNIFQRVSHDVQISYLELFSFSYFYFLNFQICDVMMSVGLWEKLDCWINVLDNNSLGHETWSA